MCSSVDLLASSNLLEIFNRMSGGIIGLKHAYFLRLLLLLIISPEL